MFVTGIEDGSRTRHDSKSSLGGCRSGGISRGMRGNVGKSILTGGLSNQLAGERLGDKVMNYIPINPTRQIFDVYTKRRMVSAFKVSYHRFRG